MILLIGQVEREFAGREAFQEVDYRFMFAPLSKWVAQIDRASRVPELVARAFQTAVSGRPGPVALALPEDMLAETATVAETRRYEVVRAHPGPRDLHNARFYCSAEEGGTKAPALISPHSQNQISSRPPLPFAFKTCSTIAMSCTLATSA